MRRVIALVFALGVVLGLASGAGAQWPAGWTRVELTGTYALVYVPTTVDTSRPTPIALFFHGAGGTPDVYQTFVARPADTAGLVLLMPKSMGMSWNPSVDVPAINELLGLADTQLTVDAARTGLAGHSAGGALSFILGYGSEGINAIFTLGAPYYPVDAVADPRYTPPIRMYYGASDPNYTGGSYDMLQAQWMSLGVTYESDIQTGYGHNDWPEPSMTAGFEFLVGHRYPVAGADAGPPGATDSGPITPGTDGGPITPGTDGGPIPPLADTGPRGGSGGRSSSGGCSCTVPIRGMDHCPRGNDPSVLLFAAVGLLAARRRRGA